MKKLLALLFTAVLAFTLVMPAFAQETTGTEPAPAATKKAAKKAKKEAKKHKKEAKKEMKEETK